MTAPVIHLRRIYAPLDPGLGRRILIDRLWPRGMTRERAALDLWAKEAAPSDPLRRWIRSDPSAERWPEFAVRYREELAARPEGWAPIAEAIAQGPVVLLFSSKEPERNHAVLLRDFLLDRHAGEALR